MSAAKIGIRESRVPLRVVRGLLQRYLQRKCGEECGAACVKTAHTRDNQCVIFTLVLTIIWAYFQARK